VFIQIAAESPRYYFTTEKFNDIVDQGYEYIVIVTPTYRLTSTVEDWQDYGYYSFEDNEGRIEIFCLSASHMSLA